MDVSGEGEDDVLILKYCFVLLVVRDDRLYAPRSESRGRGEGRDYEISTRLQPGD